MEEVETLVSRLDRSQYTGNMIAFIEVLEKKRFKKITLATLDSLGVEFEIRAYFHDNVVVIFEVGQENVYLKGTPFWSKDDKETLVDLIINLYHLD